MRYDYFINLLVEKRYYCKRISYCFLLVYSMADRNLSSSSSYHQHRQLVLLQQYKIKRIFCFLDEWCFYVLLLYLFVNKWPVYIIFGIGLYGTLAIITAYKNLSELQRKLDLVDPWFFWPIANESADKNKSHNVM